jgi:hypothetical protein
VYRSPQGKGESGIEAIEKRHELAHKRKSGQQWPLCQNSINV